MAPSSSLTIPVPENLAGTTSTGTLKSFDSLSLYFKRWHPPSSIPTKIGLVFLHGFLEYVDRYNSQFPLFAARGIEVFAIDQRGFGQSAVQMKGGLKSNYSDTTWPQQFKDAKVAIEEQKRWLDEKYGSGKVPLFLCGHSMGGGLSAALFTRDPSSPEGQDLSSLRPLVSGVLLSSPWLLLTKPPSSILTTVGSGIMKIFPNLKYPLDMKGSDLSHDPAIQEAWTKDPLIRGWVYAKSAFGPMLGGIEIISSKYKNWPKDLPVWIGQGKEDGVCSVEGADQFVKKLKEEVGVENVTYQTWEGGRHELMNEPEGVKEEFVHAMIEWMEKQIEGEAGEVNAKL